MNGKARKANDDVISIRIATTSDDVNVTDAGVAACLNDQTTVALSGIRWLGSGSITLFFRAGNCLDSGAQPRTR